MENSLQEYPVGTILGPQIEGQNVGSAREFSQVSTENCYQKWSR